MLRRSPAPMTPALRAAADAILTVIFAPQCASCERALESPTRGCICAACWQAIPPLPPPLCDRCGDPLPLWRHVSLPAAACARCRRAPRHVSRARAIGRYEGALRAIVHAFKYDGRRSLAKPLAALMRAQGSDILAGADLIVPVPLHFARRRVRGFNQAADLAHHLGKPVLARALRRVRSTVSQASLPAARRHANVRGAFVATRAARRVRGTVVLLVDDVSTTGATLEACARALKSAGALEVRALTAARVVGQQR
jgi:ComF family protein